MKLPPRTNTGLRTGSLARGRKEGKEKRLFRTFVRGKPWLVLAWNSFAGHEVSAPVAPIEGGRNIKREGTVGVRAWEINGRPRRSRETPRAFFKGFEKHGNRFWNRHLSLFAFVENSFDILCHLFNVEIKNLIRFDVKRKLQHWIEEGKEGVGQERLNSKRIY